MQWAKKNIKLKLRIKSANDLRGESNNILILSKDYLNQSINQETNSKNFRMTLGASLILQEHWPKNMFITEKTFKHLGVRLKRTLIEINGLDNSTTKSPGKPDFEHWGRRALTQFAAKQSQGQHRSLHHLHIHTTWLEEISQMWQTLFKLGGI